MNRTYFENLTTLIEDELDHQMYKEAYEDTRLLPPCNLTSSLVHDFTNSTPHQAKLDIRVIVDNEDRYVD